MTELYWTNERVARLNELNALGHTAAQIAEEMGTTRNAIIGKCDRDGIVFANRRPEKWQNIIRRDCREISFHDCQWPIGEHPSDPGFHFCGEMAAPGKPYCKDHCKIAYRRPKAQAADADSIPDSEKN